jgi:hypothetical protein
VYGLPREEREQVLAFESANCKIVIVPGVEELLVRIADGRHGLLVLDPRALSDVAIAKIARAVQQNDTRLVPILSFGPRAIQIVQICVATQARMAVVIRNVDQIKEHLNVLLEDEGIESGLPSILRNFPEDWPEDTRVLMTQAAILGRRATSVAQWAELRGESPHTLERRIADSLSRPPKPLLTWMLCLHVAWRIERLGLSLKTVAASAGVTSPGEIRKRLQRILPPSMDAPLKDISFTDACTAFLNAYVH